MYLRPVRLEFSKRLGRGKKIGSKAISLIL